MDQQATLKCGSVVAPLGEKARPLEKNKASGASKGLEPLSTGATTGSTGLLEALFQLFQAPVGQFC